MGSRFLDSSESGGSSDLSSLSNGSFEINASSLTAQNLIPNKAMKTDSSRKIVSADLEIGDITDLQTSLDTKTQLDFTETTNVIATPAADTLRLYSKNDKFYYKNDAGVEINILTGEKSGSRWNFSTSTASGAASGTFRFNNNTPSSATQLYININDSNDIDETPILSSLNTGDQIYFKTETNGKLYTIGGPGVSNGVYFSFLITLDTQNNTANYTDGESVGITIIPQANSLQVAYDISNVPQFAIDPSKPLTLKNTGTSTCLDVKNQANDSILTVVGDTVLIQGSNVAIDIATNLASIGTLNSEMTATEAATALNSTNISTNLSSIGTLNSEMTATEAATLANTNSIATNLSSIGTLNSEMTATEAATALNATNIATNLASIGTLNSEMTATEVATALNATNIATNLSNISLNDTEIIDLKTKTNNISLTSTVINTVFNGNLSTSKVVAPIVEHGTQVTVQAPDVRIIAQTNNINLLCNKATLAQGTITDDNQILTKSYTNGKLVENKATDNFIISNETTSGQSLTGSNNYLFGVGTGASLVANNNNILIGKNSGNFLTSSSNVGIGHNSMLNLTGGNNTALGTACLKGVVNGSVSQPPDGNTAIGQTSMSVIDTGASDNTAIGKQAGNTISTGSRNTFLGAYSDISSGILTDTICLGQGAVATASRQMMVGSTSSSQAIEQIIPAIDAVKTDLGSSTKQFKDIYLANQIILNNNGLNLQSNNISSTGGINITSLGTGTSQLNSNVAVGLQAPDISFSGKTVSDQTIAEIVDNDQLTTREFVTTAVAGGLPQPTVITGILTKSVDLNYINLATSIENVLQTPVTFTQSGNIDEDIQNGVVSIEILESRIYEITFIGEFSTGQINNPTAGVTYIINRKRGSTNTSLGTKNYALVSTPVNFTYSGPLIVGDKITISVFAGSGVGLFSCAAAELTVQTVSLVTLSTRINTNQSSQLLLAPLANPVFTTPVTLQNSNGTELNLIRNASDNKVTINENGLTIYKNPLSAVGYRFRMVTANHLAFETSNTERMRITEDGFIGVGTDSPANMLHLRDTNGLAEIQLERASDNKLVLGSNSLSITKSGSSSFAIGTNTANSLNFKTSNTNRIIIGADGSVDIPVSTNTPLQYIENSASDPSPVSGSSILYAKDVSNSSEMFCLDASGNSTRLSSHNSADEWEYLSTNSDGILTRINMISVIQCLEQLTGKTFIHHT